MKANSLLAGILSVTIWFGVLAPFAAIWSPVRATEKLGNAATSRVADGAPVKICLAAPQVTSGTITGDAFNDRLVAAFSADSQFLVERLDAAENDTIRRQQAAQHGCDYLLTLTLSSDEGKSKPAAVAEKVGKVAAGPFGKLFGSDPKFSVTANYRLEIVALGQAVDQKTVKESAKDPDNAVQTASTKIRDAVLPKIKSTLAQLPTKPPANATSSDSAVGDGPRQTAEAGVRPRLVVQTAHAGSVSDFAYSADGALLATLGSDGTAKIWLTASGKELLTIAGYRIGGFAFNPTGRTLACVSRDGSVRIFDLATGNMSSQFLSIPVKGNGDTGNELAFMSMLIGLPPIAVAYSSDGRLLVNNERGGIRIRELDTGATRQIPRTGDEQSAWQAKTVALSPDGMLVAGTVGTEADEVKVWTTKDRKEVRSIPSGFAHVSALEFTPDGSSLVLGSSYGSIKVFEARKGKLTASTLTAPADKAAGTKRTAKTLAGVLSKAPGLGVLGDIANTTGKVMSGIEAADNMLSLMNGSYFKRGIRSVAASFDGRSIAYKNGEDVIRVVETATGRQLSAIGKSSAEGSEAQVTSLFFALCPVKFSPDGKTVSSCTEQKTIAQWDAVTAKQSYSLGVAKRGANANGGFADLIAQSSSAQFLNDRTLVTTAATGGVRLWDLERGGAPETYANTPGATNRSAISPDGRYILQVAADGVSIVLRDLISGRELRTFPMTKLAIGAGFSPDGRIVIAPTWDVRKHSDPAAAFGLSLYDLASGREVYAPPTALFARYQFSPDGRFFALVNAKQEILILRTNDWQVQQTIKLKGGDNVYAFSPLAFSADGRWLATQEERVLKVWETATGRLAYQKPLPDQEIIVGLLFRPGTSVLTFSSLSGLSHWDLTVDRITRSTVASEMTGQLSYSPNGKVLALGSAENKVRLIAVEQDREFGSLLDPNNEDWLVVTPAGRLDTNRLEDVQEVHWILPSEPFTPQSLEVFMRFYYEPRLLARLLGGEEFTPLPDLTALNRTQPSVKIVSVTPTGDVSARVVVEVADQVSATQRSAAGEPLHSGVYDVRLFRDGQLVGFSTDDERLNELSRDPSPPGSPAGVAAWRRANAVSLNAESKHTLTFENIRLPQRALPTEAVFTAYAFNEDRVKSISDTARVVLPASPQPRRGRAYVITVGVNAYENQTFDLSFAANDARRMSETLSQRLRTGGQYEEVVPVTLISERQSGGTNAVRREATKENFKTILDILAGRGPSVTSTAPAPAPAPAATQPNRRNRGPAAANKKPGAQPAATPAASANRPAPLAGIANISKLAQVTPDDLVVILFSSHGYADRAGKFYLIPYDTGAGTQKVFNETVRQHSISSDELSLWMRRIDAGELVLIVDACHSAAAVESSEFKPGPMGSRGLGQLSYDKGMRILTATQSDSVALENQSIRQGLLSYALTREGLDGMKADYHPQDRSIMLAEWLQYGVMRVPGLNDEIAKGQITPTSESAERPKLVPGNNARGLFDTAGPGPTPGTTPAPGTPSTPATAAPSNASAVRLQRPSLFDFARARRDLVIVRTP